jgi:hypothetical protein
MEIEDLSDAAAALRAADSDRLAALVAEVTETVEGQGMRVLPARVDGDTLVTLDAEALTAGQVLAVAGAAGAAFIYLHRDLLDRDAIAAAVERADLPVQCPERDRFLQALSRAAGWTGLIELAFAHAGVLHVWETAAPWHPALEGITTAGGRSFAGYLREGDDANRSSPQEIATLAQRVAALPEFRRATRRPDRAIAAHRLPEVAALNDKDRWQADSVIRRAEELLRTEAATWVEVLKPRTAELAATLAADPAFREVSTADARQRFTDDWLLSHSNGVRLEGWFVREIASKAHRVAKTVQAGQLVL